MDGPTFVKNAQESLVRTFVAIELPATVKGKLAAVERAFGGHTSVVKWVAPDLLHITVRFLGGVPYSRLRLIQEAAARSASVLQPFILQVTDLGAFPNERTPRVVWAGLEADQGYTSLGLLHDFLEEELAQRGFQREDRRFSPHITLARTRDHAESGERRQLGETLKRVRGQYDISGRFDITHLTVMQSQLGKAGPMYRPLASIPLGTKQ